MASKTQMTGMLGVYLTAAELVKLGFIVSPTSRSALGADLLVTDQRCQKSWSVQVKTGCATVSFWLMSKDARHLQSPSHIYVFVYLPKKGEPRFYVVPSRVVASAIRLSPRRSTGSVWHWYKRDERYRDKWKLFGNPLGVAPAKQLSSAN